LFPLLQSSSYYDKTKKNIADHTISVRLYGVDTPELGKFGKPAMPLADEAKEFTKSLVGDKVVRVKMLKRDRYSRVVGKVTTRYVG
jgi:endonuclease YncB( thermonuclease family)